MTLGPGASVAFPFPMPPHIAEVVARGGQLTVEHGPVVETSPDHFERMVEILVDGDRVGGMVLGWQGRPSRLQRIWDWLRRRPRLEGAPDLRIELDGTGNQVPR